MNARAGLFTQFLTATTVLTRLPVGSIDPGVGGVAASCWAFPAVGAGIGGLCAAAMLLATLCGFAGRPAALLAVGAGILVTGALHEDGLADTVDGFGGGRGREAKLRIMRDSRIGTYGVVALLMSVGLRVEALTAIGGVLDAALALIAAHAVSRALVAPGMRLLDAARSDGLGAAAGRPGRGVVLAALGTGIAVGLAALGPLRGAVAIVLAGTAVAATAALARRQIGGYTGDVLGALQQIGEIVMLLVAAAK